VATRIAPGLIHGSVLQARGPRIISHVTTDPIASAAATRAIITAPLIVRRGAGASPGTSITGSRQISQRIADVAQTRPPILLEAAFEQAAQCRRRVGRQCIPVGLALENGRDQI
jgi:hypothetical protein